MRVPRRSPSEVNLVSYASHRSEGSNVALVEARNMWVKLSGTPIIKGASLRIERCELVALVGRNGAGKTTLLNALSGLRAMSEGSVSIRGVDVSSQGPEDRRNYGLVHVPEGHRVFPSLTVRENLIVGGWGRSSVTIDDVIDRLPALGDILGASAGTLASSDRQLCCLGRALMADPCVLLLDEIFVGLSPLAADELLGQFPDLVSGGVSMLLVDQNIGRSMAIADRTVVIDAGRIVADGTTGELLAKGLVPTGPPLSGSPSAR